MAEAADADWEPVYNITCNPPAQLQATRRKLIDATGEEEVPEGGKRVVGEGGDTCTATYHLQIRNAETQELHYDSEAKGEPKTSRIVGPESDPDYGMGCVSGMNFGLTGLKVGETWELRVPKGENSGAFGANLEHWTVKILKVE